MPIPACLMLLINRPYLEKRPEVLLNLKDWRKRQIAK